MPANYAVRPEWRVAEEEEGGETADDSSSADDAERSSEKDSLTTLQTSMTLKHHCYIVGVSKVSGNCFLLTTVRRTVTLVRTLERSKHPNSITYSKIQMSCKMSRLRIPRLFNT